MEDIFELSIRRDRLYKQVADQIQELIVAESLKPGDRLPSERELAERLGLSRTVVREAIHTLAVRGLVHVKPGCGAYVRELRPEDAAASMGLLLKLRQAPRSLDDLYEVRRMLEAEIAALAAERATADDVRALQEAVAGMEESADDLERYAEYELAFHAALAAATQNGLFCTLLDSIGHLWHEIIRISLDAPGAPRDGLHYHRQILACIEQRDIEGARRVMLEHVRHSQHLVEAVSKRAPARADSDM